MNSTPSLTRSTSVQMAEWSSDFLWSMPLSTWMLIGTTFIVSYATLRSIHLMYFHPLAKFPGPKIAAVSNIWYAYHWFSGRYPWAIQDVLNKYGDVARIAPNELVFMNPQAHIDILMSGTKNRPTFIKTDFQHIGGEHAGIAAETDVEKHKAVRKLLAPAFNARALKEQEPALHDHVDHFINQLEKLGTTETGVDMREWFDWLTCDIAGDMSYGHSFNNVKDTRANLFLATLRHVGLWGTLNQVMKRFPLLYPLVFLALPPKLATTLPTLLRSNLQIVQNRVKRRDNLNHPDYFTLLLPDDRPLPSNDFLLAQANHLIVGGYDPDTNLFTAAMHFLLENTQSYDRLKAEIRSQISSYDQINNEALQSLPYLHAVIDETLRLHTNSSFGAPRVSPGDTVDGHYIAKGCVVQIATFAVAHSERFFKEPLGYHPERWLPASHVHYDPRFSRDDKTAFKPFSMGPRGCIGQNMGYMQGRIVLAKMIWYFDWVLLNKGEVDWLRDVRLYAMWEKPPVIVKYTRVARDREGSVEKAENQQ